MVLAAFAQFLQFWPKGVAKWRHPGPVAVVLVGILGLSSCAVSPVGDGSGAAATPEARNAAVTTRANARWDALIKGDLDAAYLYLSPASREATSLAQYKRGTRRGGFSAAKVEAVECSADLCTVKLMITYDHRLMKGIQTPLEETWIWDKGQPWLVYRESVRCKKSTRGSTRQAPFVCQKQQAVIRFARCWF